MANPLFQISNKQKQTMKMLQALKQKDESQKVEIDALTVGVQENFDQIRNLITRVEELENPAAGEN